MDNALVIVTGAGGMLGRDVTAELERRGVPFRALDRSACDVTSMGACHQALSAAREEAGDRDVAVINCAAYTDVNGAETATELADSINAWGPRNLAEACALVGARLIHVSTDYVFDGSKDAPYEVDDLVNPVNAYGLSKMMGETPIPLLMKPGQWTIARTSWLYGAHGPNFVKTMLKLAGEGRDLKVINDQVGAPTYTVDLARALVDLAVRPEGAGMVYVTNGGACSWFEFAQEIFALSGVHPASLSPCATDDFPTPARRPANSRLSDASLRAAGVEVLPPWQDGLRRYLAEVGALAVS